MKKTIFLVSILVLTLILSSCSNDGVEHTNPMLYLESSKESYKKSPNYSYSELERLTKKIQRFHNFEVAVEQGWDTDATGYVPHMGHHYIKASLIDGLFDLENPEALLYVPDANGQMQFVGVEYLVPMELLDDPSTPPEGFVGDYDQWAIVDIFWTLHAWVGLENPNGVFAPMNPLVD